MNKGATMSLNKLLTTREVAKYLDVAESTVIQYRVNGTGPKYIKFGHIIRYRRRDIEVWLWTREPQENK